MVKGRSLAKDQPSQHPYRITHNCLSGHLDVCGRPHICIEKKKKPTTFLKERRKSRPPAASCCLRHSPVCGYSNISNSLNSGGGGGRAEGGKCLFCKHEDLGLDPQRPHKPQALSG